MAAADGQRVLRLGSRLIGGLIGGLLGGFLAGVIGPACATSDAMLEKKRREDAMLGKGDRCYPGVSEECYSGKQGTAGRGACRLGRHTCSNGVWSSCEGEVLPGEETCNKADDDCDGVVDNGFEREGALCFFKGAKGACKTQGKWTCAEDGKSSTCDAPVVKPKAESCNGIDDDCDGQADEDSIPATQAECLTGKAGVCDAGTNKCIKGKVKCVQDIQPGAEICNGLDDDCDGNIDNDCVSEADAAAAGH